MTSRPSQKLATMNNNKEVYISVTRDGYNSKQISSTMTVADLISRLQDFDRNSPVYISFDGGYTVGALNEDALQEVPAIEDDDE